MDKPPKANFEFNDTFQVWRVLQPATSTLLLIELRNATELETVFVCADLATSKIIWDDLSFENSWAFSMSDADRRNMFFTEFEDGETPNAKAVMAISIHNKEILWYKEKVTFEGLINNVAILDNKYDEQVERIYIHAETGEVTDQQLPQDLLRQKNTHIQLPSSYEVNTAYFNTVSEFLKENEQLQIVKSCDYLEYNSYIIIGFYTLNERNKLNNYIILLDKTGKQIYKEQIGNDLDGLASESFFITGEYLIYIKHKKEIVTIYLKD